MVVASTGNTGDNAVTFPASSARHPSRGQLRVSVTSVDRADDKSDFATYGPAVELVAPGEDVFGPAPDLGVAAWTGTSMAAPMAAGALALALGGKSELPREELAAELQNRAADIFSNNQNAAYKNHLGDGRLDVGSFILGLGSTTR